MDHLVDRVGRPRLLAVTKGGVRDEDVAATAKHFLWLITGQGAGDLDANDSYSWQMPAGLTNVTSEFGVAETVTSKLPVTALRVTSPLVTSQEIVLPTKSQLTAYRR